MYRHRVRLRRMMKLNRIKRLGVFLFISGLAFALVSSIWAIYLNSFLNNDSTVGFVSSFLVLVSFISYFLIIPVIERSNKFKIGITSTFLIMIGYFCYSLINHFSLVILIALFLTVAIAIKISSFGILIERNSDKRDLSKNEGFVYAFINLAYVIGPLIVGVLLAVSSIRSVFLVAVGFLIFSILFLRGHRFKSGGVKKKLDKSPIKNLVDFFKNKDRLKIYLLGGGVNFWWAMIVTYVPLYIITHLEVKWVGYFLFGIAVPLVLFEYSFAQIAGRKGYKRFFFVGYLGAGLIALACFFVSSIYVVLGLLVLASVFLAMLEPLTESYFFDICRGKQDQRFYAPYNTAIDFGGFLGEIFGAIFLLFFNIGQVFIVYAVGMLLLSLLSLSVRDIIERRR